VLAAGRSHNVCGDRVYPIRIRRDASAILEISHFLASRLPVDQPARADHEKFPAVKEKNSHKSGFDTGEIPEQSWLVKTKQPRRARYIGS
jgi:hypothetical protein